MRKSKLNIIQIHSIVLYCEYKDSLKIHLVSICFTIVKAIFTICKLNHKAQGKLIIDKIMHRQGLCFLASQKHIVKHIVFPYKQITVIVHS